MKGVLISMVFQIGSALLDACVLSALEEEPLYGYALTQKVKSVVDISESTLYPVLRRLTKDGLLSTCIPSARATDAPSGHFWHSLSAVPDMTSTGQIWTAIC